MKAQDLKNSILQLAIEGKLVLQDPDDVPAKKLLAQIQKEKEQLIKDERIKRNSKESVIFRDNGHFYEKAGKKGEPVCIDEEIPFDIPDTWEWVKLNTIVTVLGDGLHGTPNYDINGDYYFINGNNLKEGLIFIKDSTKKVNKEEYLKYKKPLTNRTILVSINGTIGNIAFFNNERVMLGKSACYFNLCNNVSKQYMKLLIESRYFMDYALESATGTTIKNVSLKAMKNWLIPLPTLIEQKRIVKKIEELIPYVKEYGEAGKKLEELNETFPEQIKASILQEAVQGKLVPQNPDDVPAKKLLAQIQKEKEQLIKDKKIKRNSKESVIFRDNGHFYEKVGNKGEPICIDEEIPFDIPDTWEWTTLQNIADIILGQSPPSSTYNYKNEGLPFYQGKAEFGDLYPTPRKWCNVPQKISEKGDVLISVRAPVGPTNICSEKSCIGRGLAAIRGFKGIDTFFILYSIRSFERIIAGTGTGTTFKAITGKQLREFKIPIPPTNEQKRIVKKIEELLEVCENLILKRP